MSRKLPIRNAEYTFKQICEELNLKDTPFLRFHYNGEIQVVQTSHCTEEQMMALPFWAESCWRYQYTTDEWIPLFMFAKDQDIHALVDIAPMIDPYAESPNVMHVTPKGLPEAQYYSVREDGKLVSPSGDVYNAPVFDDDGNRIH